MIAPLAEWRIEAGTIDGLTGVWVPRRDKPQGGVRGRSARSGSMSAAASPPTDWRSMSTTILQPFEWIVPCGIDDCRMTSVSRELGSEQDLEAFAATLADRLAHELDRAPQPLSPSFSSIGSKSGPPRPQRYRRPGWPS